MFPGCAPAVGVSYHSAVGLGGQSGEPASGSQWTETQNERHQLQDDVTPQTGVAGAAQPDGTGEELSMIKRLKLSTNSFASCEGC